MFTRQTLFARNTTMIQPAVLLWIDGADQLPGDGLADWFEDNRVWR
jgi:hypothetical protein